MSTPTSQVLAYTDAEVVGSALAQFMAARRMSACTAAEHCVSAALKSEV